MDQVINRVSGRGRQGKDKNDLDYGFGNVECRSHSSAVKDSLSLGF